MAESLFFRIVLGAGLDPTSENFRHAPCLCNATSRGMRLLGVRDLADETDRVVPLVETARQDQCKPLLAHPDYTGTTFRFLLRGLAWRNTLPRLEPAQNSLANQRNSMIFPRPQPAPLDKGGPRRESVLPLRPELRPPRGSRLINSLTIWQSPFRPRTLTL